MNAEVMAPELTFEQWRDTLRAFCGNFDVSPGNDLTGRHGRFGKHRLGGMEMSHIVTNYDSVHRDRRCIRSDDVDCLFLVRQLSGRMFVEHGDQSCELDPGDCVLLDSTAPLSGHYGRAGVEFATLHVPRSELFREDGDAAIECGAVRRAADPRGQSLNAALSFVSREGLVEDTGRGFIVDLARLVFRREPRSHSLHRFGSRADRITALLETIDRHADVQEFDLSSLAAAAGMSERQVQRDLQSRGTSFSAEIMRCRMSRVRDALAAAAAAGERPHVAQIAYQAGFNDLSYFNRAFRRQHGCTPLEFARERAPL